MWLNINTPELVTGIYRQASADKQATPVDIHLNIVIKWAILAKQARPNESNPGFAPFLSMVVLVVQENELLNSTRSLLHLTFQNLSRENMYTQ